MESQKKKKSLKQFFKSLDSKMYFRIRRLFIRSCSEYLNFQGSAKKNKKKNSSECAAKETCPSPVLLEGKQKSKLQNALSGTELSWKPTDESLKVGGKALKSSSAAFHDHHSPARPVPQRCIRHQGSSHRETNEMERQSKEYCDFLTDVRYHQWGYKPRFKCKTGHKPRISKVWGAEKKLTAS